MMRRRLFCLVLAPLVWSWDPVTVDCKGQPEPGRVTYAVAQVLVEPAGYRDDCALDEDGQEVCIRNIVYHPGVYLGETQLEEPRFPDDAVYPPAAGGVTFWEPTAIDEAGNRSGPVCQ